MGIGSSSSAAHRRQHRPPPPATTPQQPHNGDVIGATNSPISNPANYPYGAPLRLLGAPFVEHQKTVTIKNDVNIKKDSIRIEMDEESPGKFLVAFTFDAATPGSITVMFYTKEDAEFNLVATKESLLDPVRVTFDKGLGQSFRQPCGTGVDFSLFEDVGLTREGDAEVYPLVVKAEAQVVNEGESDGNASGNCQITQAVFEKKENGEYKVRVVKQILWVDNMRYELQEIYGIGNAVEEGAEQNDDDEAGKECVICLSEPRDTTALPCRHM